MISQEIALEKIRGKRMLTVCVASHRLALDHQFETRVAEVVDNRRVATPLPKIL